MPAVLTEVARREIEIELHTGILSEITADFGLPLCT